MITKTFDVKGMHCASCVNVIEKTLQKVDGVKQASVNLATNKATLHYHENASEDDMAMAVKRVGYELESQEKPMGNKSHDHISREGLKDLKEDVYISLGLIFLNILIMVGEFFFNLTPSIKEFFHHLLPIFATYMLFVVGRPYLAGMWRFIKYKRADMDALVGIGTSIAFLYSFVVTAFEQSLSPYLDTQHNYYDVTIIVIGLITLGKYLENQAKSHTSDAIKKLIGLQAKTARIVKDGKEVDVPIEQVKVGDLIRVRPGEKIPVDGIIIEGESAIDESMVTGESIPIDKTINALVIGATLNKSGSFLMKATKVGKDTMLSQIVKLVEEAQGSKAPIQDLADRVSEIFVPTVLVISVLTFLGWWLIGGNFIFGLISMIAVLVIACPCAMGLATPTAIMVGTGIGAERGILIKNAQSLESAHKINTVIFDKTGTLTNGKPEVTDIVGEVLQLAASLEKRSEHSLADAITKKAEQEKLMLSKVEKFKAIPGRGVEGIINNKKIVFGNIKLMKKEKINYDHLKKDLERLEHEGKTVMLLGIEGKLIGLIAVADTIKPSAKDAVRKLKEMNIIPIVVSGDNPKTAEAIAKQVGIDQFYAGVLPNEKEDIVRRLRDKPRIAGIKIFNKDYATEENYKKVLDILEQEVTLEDDQIIRTSLGDLLLKKNKNEKSQFRYLLLKKGQEFSGFYLEGKRIVAMVGDGINDAPALAAADIGIAMGSGTDVAIEAADITLINKNLNSVAQSINLSKKTIRTIKLNLFWAFGYNVMLIPVAILGMVNPIFASAAMALSSISVVGNSLLLRKAKI